MSTDPKLTLEAIRENMLVVGKAVNQLDDLVNNLADARWKFEMLSRIPALGASPRAGAEPVATAERLFGNIQSLEMQRQAAADILMTLTNTVSVEEARVAYLLLFSAYQRHSQVIELQTFRKAGAPLDESQLANILGEFPATDLGISDAIAAALTRLGEVAEEVKVPLIQIPTPPAEGASLTLPE